MFVIHPMKRQQTRGSQHSQECYDPRIHMAIFVPRVLDLLIPKINEFLGLMLEHFCVKFGDPGCTSF